MNSFFFNFSFPEIEGVERLKYQILWVVRERPSMIDYVPDYGTKKPSITFFIEYQPCQSQLI